MKKQVLSLMVLALLTIFACKETATEASTDMNDTEEKAADQTDAPDYAKFDRNAAVLAAYIQAHCDENLAAQSALISDTLKWSPPMYNGNKWLGKEDLVAALKGYHDNYEDIKYTPGITLPNDTGSGVYSGNWYPKDIAANNADAIRQYGTWSAKHTASGKEIGVKWFAVSTINADGKIAMVTEYWDVHGLAAQIADE